MYGKLARITQKRKKTKRMLWQLRLTGLASRESGGNRASLHSRHFQKSTRKERNCKRVQKIQSRGRGWDEGTENSNFLGLDHMYFDLVGFRMSHFAWMSNFWCHFWIDGLLANQIVVPFILVKHCFQNFWQSLSLHLHTSTTTLAITWPIKENNVENTQITKILNQRKAYTALCHLWGVQWSLCD